MVICLTSSSSDRRRVHPEQPGPSDLGGELGLPSSAGGVALRIGRRLGGDEGGDEGVVGRGDDPTAAADDVGKRAGSVTSTGVRQPSASAATSPNGSSQIDGTTTTAASRMAP